MARLGILLIPLLIAAYLYALWSDWFTEVELNDAAKRPLYRNYLDLGKVGQIIWDIEPERLRFAHGKAKLSLSLNPNAMLEIPESREAVNLRVKVVAQGRQPNGQWQDRLIRDWYFQTDQPFSKEGEGLWVCWGFGRVEYGLGGVEVVPGEEVRITLDVQVPDGLMMTGYPRLKLVSAQDGHGYGSFLRFAYRGIGFLLSLAGLAWLSLCAWRGQKRAEPETRTAVIP